MSQYQISTARVVITTYLFGNFPFRDVYGSSEQPSILTAPGISGLHRLRTPPVWLATLPEPAIHAGFRNTTPSPRPAACGAGTGSPARSWRTAGDGSSESRGNRTFSKPKIRFRIRNGCSTFARTLAFTRFLAFCNSSTKFLYLTSPASHILRSRSRLPDRFPLSLIPSIAPHLALFPVQPNRAACACPPPKPPTCTPNAHDQAWSPLRCAPSTPSTTASLRFNDEENAFHLVYDFQDFI